MIKRKNNSKKILVFLLILGFIGNTVSHMQITASAAGAEKTGQCGGAVFRGSFSRLFCQDGGDPRGADFFFQEGI